MTTRATRRGRTPSLRRVTATKTRRQRAGASAAVRMIDVGPKRVTRREATASAWVHVGSTVLERAFRGRLPKGDVRAVAEVAGIAAAKQSAGLIPLCHPLPLEAVEVSVTPEPPGAVRITATVRARARTGVEMEALTAAAVAALTVYDLCKSAARSAWIGPIRLDYKAGGRSGTYRRR